MNIYSSYRPETKNTDKWTYEWWMEGHTDIQCETVIPSHFRVAGFKKGFESDAQ